MNSKRILLALFFTLLSTGLFSQTNQDLQKGFDNSLKIIELIKNKEYTSIKASLLPQIAKTVPNNVLKKYTDQGAGFISKYGIPDQKYVNKRLMVTKINDKSIVNEESTVVIYFDYPFPVPNAKGQPGERIISIGYIQELGFDKFVSLQVIDNTDRPVIKPSFAKLEKLEFNIDDISRFRFRYSGGNVRPESSQTVTGNLNQLRSKGKLYEQSKRVLDKLKVAAIVKTEPIKDMPRHNGRPEMVNLQLNFEPNFMAPPESIKKPHIMILLILNEESGKPEKNVDWIEVRQFSGINIGYKYFLNAKDNIELFNEIVALKELL